MTVYADYQFYNEQFGGSVIPQTAFIRWSTKASKLIDQFTSNRITEVTQEVKTACCEVADILYKAEESDGKEVASESAGSCSVAYVATGKTLNQKCLEATKLWIGETGLLYRGVR